VGSADLLGLILGREGGWEMAREQLRVPQAFFDLIKEFDNVIQNHFNYQRRDILLEINFYCGNQADDKIA
jgi:hypothetical protein